MAKPSLKKKKPLTIDQQADARAQAEIAPQLGEIDAARRRADSKHATRQQQQAGWYGGFADTLNKSFANTTQALNNLISLNNQGSADSQKLFSAALNAGQAPVSQAASQLGVAAPQSAANDVYAAALANTNASRNVVGSNALNLQSAYGNRLALAPIGAIQAGNLENARYDAEDQEFNTQRRGLTSQLGALKNKYKTDLENQAFQQYLAEQELGLKKKNQTFEEWLAQEQLGLDQRKFNQQTKLDWANLALNQRQVEAELLRIKDETKKAKTAEGKERAKLRGQQWNRGLELLSNYLKPGEGEAAIGDENPVDNPNTLDEDESQLKKYRRAYNDAFRLLTGQARMSRLDALRLLATSDFESWRKRARKELNNLKKSGSRRSIGDISSNRPAPKGLASIAQNPNSAKIK